LAAQDEQLHAASCAKVYSEKVSRAKTDRVELAKLLKRLEPGDVPMVTRRQPTCTCARTIRLTRTTKS